MKSALLSRQLEDLVCQDSTLRELVSVLREYRLQGLSRKEAQQALATLRERVKGDAAEDRVLEIMDIVSGFCSKELTVWD